MSYNLTAIAENSTTLASFFGAINTELGLGWLGTILLFGITIVIYLSLIFSTNDGLKSLIAATFIGFTLSLLFRALGLVSDSILFIYLIGLALILAFSFRNRQV